MHLKKIALASFLACWCSFLAVQRVIHYKFKISVRELARLLNAPASCQTTQIMNINFLDELDVSNHFDSASKLNIPSVGEFSGVDRIKEAIKVSKSSYTEEFVGFNYASSAEVLTEEDRYFEFLDEESTEDECVVVAGTVANLKLGNNFNGEGAIKTTVNSKIKFKVDNDSLIFSEVGVSLPDDLMPTMASKINPIKFSESVCKTMKEHCKNTWDKNGFEGPNGMNKCKRAFKKLPSGKEGETDGNTKACRIFQAAIIETSGDTATATACAALSFKKSKGDDGCRDENVKKTEDIFGVKERAYFSEFNKKEFGNYKGFKM